MPSRICGTVIAGEYFFSPMRFTHQEPSGDQRENLMMMPAAPIANFVVRKPCLALAALDRLFDAMGCQRNAGKFLERSLARSVRQIEVVFGHVVFVQIANDHQRFFVLHGSPLDFGLHATCDDFDFQRTLFRIANLDASPSVLGKRIAPLVNTLKRLLGYGAAALILGWLRVQITNQRVAWNGQQILLATPKDQTRSRRRPRPTRHRPVA